MDAGTDRGLKQLTNSIGLDFDLVTAAMSNKSLIESWKDESENNCKLLAQYNIWGVPCFSYQHVFVWGQDKLWVIEELLYQAHKSSGNLRTNLSQFSLNDKLIA